MLAEKSFCFQVLVLLIIRAKQNANRNVGFRNSVIFKILDTQYSAFTYFFVQVLCIAFLS